MLNFEAYNYDDTVQDQLKLKIHGILEEHSCGDLIIPVFTAVNELLVNAIKANFKNIYFENYHDNSIPYDKALKLFRFEISSDRIDHLIDIAKKNGVKAVVNMDVKGDILFTEVVNPYPMTTQEKSNVDSKMKLSKKISTVSDIFNVSEKDPYKEGAGLGLVFVAIMLKSMNSSDADFTVVSDAKATKASFSVPLTNETVEFYRKYRER